MDSPRDNDSEPANTPGTQQAATGADQFSTFKLITFSIVICALFFILVEVLLWGLDISMPEQSGDPFIGFSSQTKLFIESPANKSGLSVSSMETNKDKLFFFQPQSFALKKPENVRRVFCIGGSTTYGRPYAHSTSFCGWLADFLAYTDPEQKWEVINAGGISYASYRVVILLEELIQYEPDLIISYVGQNEFLERRTYSQILGLPRVLRDLGTAASSLRIYALMNKIVNSLKNDEAVVQATHEHKLGKEVNTILDQSIGPEDYVRDDEQKEKVINHFEYNLEKIAQLTRSTGAQLIMVAPASKLRNESPFKSQNRNGLKGPELEAWQQHYESAQALYREKHFAAALTAVSKAETLDPRHAHTLSLKGDILYALENHAEARLSYQKALDEDICPLRALSPLHSLVLNTAHKMNIPAVDFDAIISKLSPNGITDDVFFLDHVHPTIEGNKILALELLKEVIDSGMIQSPKPMTEASLQAISTSKISQLDQNEHSDALSNLSMLANWGGKFREGKILAQRAIDLNPRSVYSYFMAGSSIMNIGEDIEQAIDYFNQALSLSPGDAGVYEALGKAYALLGRNNEAKESYQFAINSTDAWVQSLAHFGIGEVLEKENKFLAAMAHYQQTLKLQPEFFNAQKRIEELLLNHPELADANVAVK